MQHRRRRTEPDICNPQPTGVAKNDKKHKTMEEKINPEQLVRDSEFINKLKEIGDDDILEAGKAFIRLSNFQQKYIGLALGLGAITKNGDAIGETKELAILLDDVLDNTQKTILGSLFVRWSLVIRDFLLNEDKEED